MGYTMKKKFIIFFLLLNTLIFGNNMKYPFIYIPGMFDNGDKENSQSLLVKNLNHEDGYYYKNYFSASIYKYNKESLICSSNIVDAKYNRLAVCNFIGEYRTNISIWLMADRLFCFMQGRAPKGKNYNKIINHPGNDYSGECIRDGKMINFKGIIEEVWAKYGKRVYYKLENDKYYVVLKKKNCDFYENKEGYYDSPEQIKFNFVVHSSGGIALRRYIELCYEEDLPVNINLIINLSVPQKGARMLYNISDAFPDLIADTVNKVFSKKDEGFIIIKNKQNNEIKYTYRELIEKTRINLLYGNTNKAKILRKILGAYVIYNVPFDGYKSVLGNDPALKDLHPKSKLIKNLKKVAIPENISIYNFRVESAYAEFFIKIGKYLKLGKCDGVVDYNDTELNDLPNSDKLNIKDYIVDKANHIPFPYIKPVFELRDTVEEFYGFLGMLVKGRIEKEKGIILVYALMKVIMNEMNLDLDYLLKNEDYSVIDYFAEHPIEIE